MAKNIKLTENNAKKSPQGGVLVGKKDGQTIIYDDGKVGGWFVGKTHKEGGIQGIDKTSGQPIEVQTGEVIITAPALADQTPRNFQGKMMTNRQILSKINSDAGGVAFAEDGMEIPSKILCNGGSYKYGGKMMSDKEIADEINKCGCDHEIKEHLSENMSLEDIAKMHNVSVKSLEEQVEIGMEDESIHAGDVLDHFNIVKDHLVESPTFYTDENAKGQNENFLKGGLIAPNGNPSGLYFTEIYNLVRTKEFKEWFGDWEEAYKTKDYDGVSKIIDKNGEPLICVHNTDNEFFEFNENYIGTSTDAGYYGRGFYFFPNVGFDKYGQIELNCFLNIRNPYLKKDSFKNYELNTEELKNEGYDGVIVYADWVEKFYLEYGVSEAREIVAYYPEQIKLGDGTNTTFDKYNDDIRFVNGGDIKSLYENENDYIKYLVEFNLTDGVESYKLHKYLKSKGLSSIGLLPDNIKKDPEYIKVKRDYDLAFARLRQMPIYKYPKNRDRVQESKDRKIAQSITDKIIQIKLKKEKFVNGGGLIAPNGNPSNLTPEQYHLVRTPEFKAWFGDWENEPANSSEILDENGEPKIMYHGSRGDFNVFSNENENKLSWTEGGFGFYFTSNYNSALGYGRKVISAFINSRAIKKSNETEHAFVNETDLYKLRKSGFDSIYFNGKFTNTSGKRTFKDDELVIFEPNQIKLADGTNKTFDSNNDDIRFKHGGEMKKENLVKDAKDGNTPARDLNNYNDMLDVQADGQVGGDTGIYKDGGAISDWDATFTSGFNKGQKLSEQEIETIDVYNDFIYGLLFKSGGSFDAKTEETIGLLSVTNNPVNLAVILEKDPSGFNTEAIRYNQKIKRRLHNLAEKSNRKIILNNNASSRVNRQFPYLLVSENDAKNYDLATEFYEKLETPRKESRKKLIEELEKEKEGKKEYEYILTQRPFDIGTYPKENFIRFEQQKYQFGVVIYSKPISIREIKHFSLCPITEIKDFNNKFLYYLVSDTKQKIQIKLIPDKRIGYFVDIIYYDGDKVEDTQMISAVKFLENIQEGHYKLENDKTKLSEEATPEITNGYFIVDSDNTGFEYAKKINNYFNKWNKIKTLKDKLDFEKLDVPMFGSFENENVLNQIEHFEKIGFELGANEIVRKDFKKEVQKIIDKKIFDREMDKRRYPKEDEELTKKEKSFESEGSTEGKGKLYEFFTPQIVADKMLALAQHYGFKGGNVLEPATGSGRLIKNLKNTNITAFEISKDNFEILKREFPNAELYNFNFEKAFLKEPRFNTLLNRKGTETWLKNAPFDLVMANPPYGKFSGLYSSYFKFKGQVEHFFILQTLHLLKKGGLGVYLIPSSFMRNGIAYNDIKKEIFEIAELVDAYRLPSNIFEKTQIGTDILILRKK